jgi:glycosyltransferase involved in cell wall biosynthesis
MSSSITVGIPFFAGSSPEQFQASVDSILTQTLCPDEIHLIQDGSISEELNQLVEAYVASFSYVKRLVIENNAGLAHAINYSLLNTITTYYARMDSDDIAHPQRLEKQVAYLTAHQDIDILGTWALEFETDPLTEVGFIRQLPTEQTDIEAMFHYRNPFVHPAVVFRRSVFAKIGLYNINFVDEDLELWSRALQKKVKVANLPEVLLYYRFSGSIQRRAERVFYHVFYHAKARYQFNTWSPKLNMLKLMSLLLKFLPYEVREWAYKNLRS